MIGCKLLPIPQAIYQHAKFIGILAFSIQSQYFGRNTGSRDGRDITIPGRRGRAAAKLRDEAPGILRWMIQGCLAWRQVGLGRCRATETAEADYLEIEDILGQFLAECCAGLPEDRRAGSAAGDLYRAWCAFAEGVGEPPGSQRAFAEALGARGYRRGRSETTRFYRGLVLTHDAG